MGTTFSPAVAGSITTGATTYSEQSGSFMAGAEAGVKFAVEFDGSALAASAAGALVVNGLPLTQATPPQGIPSGFLIVNGVSEAVTLTVAQGTNQIHVTANGQSVSVSGLSGSVTLRGGLIVNT